jgi:hypothetical protein
MNFSNDMGRSRASCCGCCITACLGSGVVAGAGYKFKIKREAVVTSVIMWSLGRYAESHYVNCCCTSIMPSVTMRSLSTYAECHYVKSHVVCHFLYHCMINPA